MRRGLVLLALSVFAITAITACGAPSTIAVTEEHRCLASGSVFKGGVCQPQSGAY